MTISIALAYMLLYFSIIVVGLFILIKGANLLVIGSASIAKKLGVSSLVVGLTVVAFGTSLPELTVSMYSSIKKTGDITLGNVIGSNIANILLILGATSALGTIPVRHSTVWKEIPFSLLAIIAVGILGSDIFFLQGNTNIVSRGDGIVLLFFFIIFLYYVASISKVEKNKDSGMWQFSIGKSIRYIIFGLVGLFVGGKMFVDGSIHIAELLGLSERVTGLTIVAIGTSLPELVTSVVAARKGQNDISIGNIVGSNIFNIFWVLGISAIITPIPVGWGNFFDISVGSIATILLFLFLLIGRKNKLERGQGLIFVVLYTIYITHLVTL